MIDDKMMFVLIALCYGKAHRSKITLDIQRLSAGIIASDNWSMYHDRGPITRLLAGGYITQVPSNTVSHGQLIEEYAITPEGIQLLSLTTAAHIKFAEEGNNALKHIAANAATN